MVDETRFRSINFWFPLSPIAADAGRVRVVPGSHRFLNGYFRGSPAFPTPIDGILEETERLDSVTPVVNVGEAFPRRSTSPSLLPEWRQSRRGP
jgi:hypothetical protein